LYDLTQYVPYTEFANETITTGAIHGAVGANNFILNFPSFPIRIGHHNTQANTNNVIFL